MDRKRSRWTIPVVIAVAALLGLLTYGVVVESGGNKYENALAAGNRLPASDRMVRILNTTERAAVTDYKGKVVVLNFWASWCEPCKDEAPAINAAYDKYKDEGLVVLGADVDDLSKAANKFIIENKLTYPILRYTSEWATADYGTKQMPETFVIDRNGNVAALHRGQIDSQWLSEVLPPLLAEKSSS